MSTGRSRQLSAFSSFPLSVFGGKNDPCSSSKKSSSLDRPQPRILRLRLGLFLTGRAAFIPGKLRSPRGLERPRKSNVKVAATFRAARGAEHGRRERRLSHRRPHHRIDRADTGGTCANNGNGVGAEKSSRAFSKRTLVAPSFPHH